MKLEILKNGNPILRKKTGKIKDPLEKKVQSLIDFMLATMRSANGMGLAAPQIGESIRLCVIEENGKTYVLMNPKVTAYSKKKVLMEEGCLSFPGEFFQISRPEEVKIRYIDKEGKNAKLKADGLLARALQHEIDHLDGILITDRVRKSKKIK
ncbi:MAG: hypothetical protein ACD_11C00020G0020 [uncultured bacterium]|nr:MAG: hypothetical protein ACD_11C00020G0020 [uncultured bacterium]HBR71305.1 peptide deformylase [Candidatus Moranbacteria bacterium]